MLPEKKGVEKALENIGASAIEDYLECSGYDTHDGFHGDGVRFYKIVLEETKNIENVVRTDGWNLLPIEEERVWRTIAISVRMLQQECEIDKEELLQELQGITEGYWFFYDKSQPDSKLVPNFDKTYDKLSMNLIIALYDSVSNVIYYFEIDT